ncbi:NAD(P)-dependent oxidoreductase [Paracoccus sp. (in: a-proteobacteria)]|uniref:NAD(P)-dependent oxidoreductase n=1 Tax=Paracoccus sp. TaxID=267 RepID=UPI003A859499
MPSILAYPALVGMSYPRLDAPGTMRTVAGPEALLALPLDERAGVRVLMTSATRGCSKQVIEALPDLGFVLSQGAGQDKLDLAEMQARGIRLRSVGETVTEDVADLAMALVQVLFRNLLRADAFARSGEWRQRRFDLGDSLVGKVIGIAGLSGRIGQAIAARARVSGMRIAGLARNSNTGLEAELHDGWAALAGACDVLVLAVPGSPQLHHVIDAELLTALGPKGRLVNVGRGSLVDTEALIAALETGTIAGAALDVLEEEPSVPARLAALPNVVLTPHIGAQTWGQRARAAKVAEAEVLAFLQDN